MLGWYTMEQNGKHLEPGFVDQGKEMIQREALGVCQSKNS
jgi:hypothetical protein